MDFRGRNNQNTPATSAQPINRSTSSSNNDPTNGQSTGMGSQLSGLQKTSPGRLLQIGSVALLFAVTALVIALTFLLGFSGQGQADAVRQDKYQAVFLNNGQVYFGKVNAIGQKTIDLRGIYYLQTNGSTDTSAQATAAAATNVSLVKLGCELHAPYDQMLINSDQVIFWENLQDSSQVVTAINKYKTDNAKQQSCSQQSQNSAQQAPSTAAPTASPTTLPAPATSPTVKKP